MAEELLVAGIVRAFAERAAPADPRLVDRAVVAAVEALLSGASASEACRVGRRYMADHGSDVRGSLADTAA